MFRERRRGGGEGRLMGGGGSTRQQQWKRLFREFPAKEQARLYAVPDHSSVLAHQSLDAISTSRRDAHCVGNCTVFAESVSAHSPSHSSPVSRSGYAFVRYLPTNINTRGWVTRRGLCRWRLGAILKLTRSCCFRCTAESMHLCCDESLCNIIC